MRLILNKMFSAIRVPCIGANKYGLPCRGWFYIYKGSLCVLTSKTESYGDYCINTNTRDFDAFYEAIRLNPNACYFLLFRLLNDARYRPNTLSWLTHVTTPRPWEKTS